MSKAKHTLGPWEMPHMVAKNISCDCGHVFAGHVTVCTVHDAKHDSGSGVFLTEEEARANARLIAKSPEMATELKKAHAIINKLFKLVSYYGYADETPDLRLEKRSALLASLEE